MEAYLSVFLLFMCRFSILGLPGSLSLPVSSGIYIFVSLDTDIIVNLALQ